MKLDRKKRKVKRPIAPSEVEFFSFSIRFRNLVYSIKKNKKGSRGVIHLKDNKVLSS
jgi:hypothetical protein